MDLVESLTKSLGSLEECLRINSTLTRSLESYVTEAEENSARIRRSAVSVFPFGEFRASRLPIHDNNHTSQREAFAQRFLKPLNQRLEWSQAEHEVLQSAIDILHPTDQLELSQVNWESISEQCRRLSRSWTRSAASCQCEYIHVLGPRASRDWTVEEDALLSRLVDEFKGTNWCEIGRQLYRPPAACYIRCYESVHPVLVPTDFTKEDDERLTEAVDRLGDAGWGAIASELGTGHTQRQCMNRWTKTLMPGIQGGRWNSVLDARLRATVAIYGETNWAAVAKHIPGKTDRKCRERYFESLREGLRPAGEWTPSEDEALENGIREHGVGKWSRISKQLEGRTDRMCFLRFQKLTNDEGKLEDLKRDYDAQLAAKRGSKLARTRGSAPGYLTPTRPRKSADVSPRRRSERRLRSNN